ncbi:MAG: glycosyltransferase family 2 protein [Cryomorphaceae bacterium]
MKVSPTVSVIIPCRNEEKYIRKCIESVLANDFPHRDYELIVVDGQSTDRTVEILEQLIGEYSNIVRLENPKKIAPVAMNLGIKKAKGKIIMRMDAHTVYPNNYISRLLHWKEKLSADNVGGISTADVLNKNPTSIAIKKVLRNKFGVGNSFFRTGADGVLEVDTVPFGCYDRELLLEVGGYNERLVRNQDIELNKRLKQQGKKIYLIPEVECTYYARENFKSLARNNYDNGKWNILTVYITKNPSALSVRHFIPLCFVLALVLPLCLGFWKFQFIYVSIAVLLVYSVALLAVISKMDKSGTDTRSLLATFFTLHFSYGLGSLTGLFHIGKLLGK